MNLNERYHNKANSLLGKLLGEEEDLESVDASETEAPKTDGAEEEQEWTEPKLSKKDMKLATQIKDIAIDKLFSIVDKLMEQNDVMPLVKFEALKMVVDEIGDSIFQFIGTKWGTNVRRAAAGPLWDKDEWDRSSKSDFQELEPEEEEVQKKPPKKKIELKIK